MTQFTLKYQDGESGERKTIPDFFAIEGMHIDPTPTGFAMESYNKGRSEMTVTFDLSPGIVDSRTSVDLTAAYMTPRDVYRFEFIHTFGGSYYMEYCYRRYAAQLNHTRPHRKMSWRRLSWEQKARAIAIADEYDWYDDYYYGRV